MCKYISRIRSFPSLQKSFTPQQSGLMIPLYSDEIDAPFEIKYIYAGTIFPKTIKGPYLHTIRSGRLTVIDGEILVVHELNNNQLCEDYLTPMDQISLHANLGYCLIGLGRKVSSFINICDHAWKPDDKETIVPDFSRYDFKKWGIK